MNKRKIKKRRAMRIANMLSDAKYIPSGGAIIFMLNLDRMSMNDIPDIIDELSDVIDYLNEHNVLGVLLPPDRICVEDYEQRTEAIAALQEIINRLTNLDISDIGVDIDNEAKD